MQIQIPRPQNPIGGALNQQTHPTPATAGIEMSRYSALQANRYQIAAVAQLHQGALTQQTHPTPGVANVEYSRYKVLDAARVIPGAIPQLHQGPTIQRTDPIAVFGQPILARYPLRQFPPVVGIFENTAATGPIIFLGSTHAESVAGGPVTTGGVDTTGANLIVLGVVSSSAPPTLSDNKGNTYTLLTQQSNGGAWSGIAYCAGPIVGTGHTFTINGGVPAIDVEWYSGAASSPFDVENGASGNATQPGSVTPSQPNSLVVCVAGGSDTGALTIDSGFTITNQTPLAGGVHYSLAMAYLIETSIVAQNPSWNTTTSAAEIAVFKPAPTAGAQMYDFRLPLSARQQWPTTQYPNVPRQVDGAITQQTNPIPPVAAIEYSRYKRLDYVRAIPGPAAQPNQGARTEQTYIFPQAQAIRAMWPSPAQYPDVARQLTGATIQRTDPIFPFGSTVMSLYPGRQYATPLYDRFQVSAAAQPTFEFKLPLPNLAWWPKPAQYPDTVKRFEGALIQQKYEFILQQARRSQWLPPQFPDVIRRVEGVRIEQTYIFPQPLANLSSYPGRQFPAVAAQREQQTAAAQTYEFQLTQADRSRYPQRAIAFFAPQVTGATNQQTFEFTTPQPNLYSYPGRQIPPAAVQLHQGAQRQQTYEFRMPQPNLAWYVPAPFISGYWKHWINDVPGVTPPATRQPWPFRVSHTAGQPDPFRPSSTSGQPSPFKPSTTGLQPWPFREPD